MNERLRSETDNTFELPPVDLGLEIKREVSKEAVEGQSLSSAPQVGLSDDDVASLSDQAAKKSQETVDKGGMLPIAATESGKARQEFTKQIVEKAKHVLSQTKDDPHAQREQIGTLSKEYRAAQASNKLASETT